MVEGNLSTTNVLLAVMAVVSVLQALVLIGAAVLGYRLYRQVVQTVHDIEQRQITPLAARAQTLMAAVDGILGDVKDVTGRVTRSTERVDTAIHNTMHRVDETAGRVRASVASRACQLAGLVHGVRCAVGSLFNGGASGRSSRTTPATSA
jgi:methyl-accepting chemotaxis protein